MSAPSEADTLFLNAFGMSVSWFPVVTEDACDTGQGNSEGRGLPAPPILWMETLRPQGLHGFPRITLVSGRAGTGVQVGLTPPPPISAASG